LRKRKTAAQLWARSAVGLDRASQHWLGSASANKAGSGLTSQLRRIWSRLGFRPNFSFFFSSFSSFSSLADISVPRVGVSFFL
jgi:hypothetical protein